MKKQNNKKQNNKKYKNKKYKNKSVILGIILIFMIMLTLLGITYGFYNTKIVKNTKEKSIDTISDDLTLTYEREDSKDPVTSSETEEERGYIKKFTVKNHSKKKAQTFNIILEDIINTYDGNNWTYSLKIGEETLSEGIITSKLKKQLLIQTTIEANSEQEYSLEVKYKRREQNIIDSEGNEIQEKVSFNGELKFKINITKININMFEEVDKNTLLYAIGKNQIVNPLTVPGKESSTGEEAELSYTSDDYGTSYYYRGAVENNYVTFASMCWRIVRVLGNGDIKLVLASEKGECKEDYLTDKSALINDATSYLYGQETNVRYEGNYLESELNGWYQQKIESDINSKAILKAPWCNDLSAGSINGSNLYYNAYARLSPIADAHPSLSCKFIVPDELKTEEIKNTYGQDVESIIYETKVALLSADEVAYAGLTYDGVVSNSYLAKNAKGDWWTISPWGRWVVSSSDKRSYEIFVSSVATLAGSSAGRFIYGGIGARPSIVLNSNVKITGNGELETPYVIQ